MPSVRHAGRLSTFRTFRVALFALAAATFLQGGQVRAVVSNTVVISQVYGGGGNTGAPYTHDFIELFNRGSAPQSLAGWTLQYTSAAGTGNLGAGSTLLTDLPAVTLQPGQYFLVQEGGGVNGVGLPTPDSIDATPINMSATGGKVALVNSTAGLGCNGSSTSPCSSAQLALIIDLVGYGTANFFEGAGPAPTLSNTTAAIRLTGGCTETDNNNADFGAAAPTPRNTASTLSPCAGPTNPTGVGAATPSDVLPGNPTLLTVAVTPGQTPTSTGLAVSAGLTQIGGSASQAFFDDGTNGDVTAGDHVFSYNAVVTAGTAPGAKSLPVTITDAQARTGNATIAVNVTAPPTCNVTHTIAAIQGNGAFSPFVSSIVTTSGLVTARRSNGFYVQMDAGGDGDPATSDGILVFTSSAPPAAAAVGNEVCVTGFVTEFRPAADPTSPTLTEIVRPAGGTLVVTPLSTGNPIPAPLLITVATTTGTGAVDRLEALEGMRVSVANLTVVGPTLGNFNETQATASTNGIYYGVVTGVPRPFRETGIDVNDLLLTCAAGINCDIPRFDGNPERLRVDSDGLPGGVALNVNTGATVVGLVGPLDYGFRTYTLLQESPPAPQPVVVDSAAAVPVPAARPEEISVASLNMLRFFDNADDPDFPLPGTTGSEPILTAAAWDRRLNKASLTIRDVLRTPDILGLVEVENQAALDALAARLDADAIAAGDAAPGYTGYLVNGNDIGGIDVAFLVRTGRFQSIAVEQVGKDATYTNPNTGLAELLNDRPPLILRVVAMRPNDQPFAFTVVVNHLRSLNDIASVQPNPDPSDPTDPPCLAGAACTTGARVRAKRQAQAEYLADLLNDLQGEDKDGRVLAIGDFNAFTVSDGYVDSMGTILGMPAAPERVVAASDDLVDPDFVNLQLLAPPDERYSYVFDGNAQTLDHAVASRGMLSWVSRFAYARSNADFAATLANDGTRPERLSDHDASVTYLALGSPVIDSAVVGSGIDGRFYVDLQLTNTGGGNAGHVTIDHLVFQAPGKGRVVLHTPLPISVGDLPSGQSAVVRLSLTLPAGLERLSIVTQGAYTRPEGQDVRYSTKTGAF